MDGRKSILIVEDDTSISTSLKTFLELNGFRTICAFNGKQALAVIASGEKLDWILLDLMMPIMDGYEFLEALEDQPPVAQITIIIVSASIDAHRVGELYGLAVIQKPIDLTALLNTIEGKQA